MSFNLYSMLHEAAASRPHGTALISGDGTLTYAELDGAAQRLSDNLRATGHSQGARMGVQLSNRPEFVIAYFGLLRAGMVMVPLNPQLRGGEVAHQLIDSGAVGLITEPDSLTAALDAAHAVQNLEIYVAGLSGERPNGCADFAELQTPVVPRDAATTGPEDTAVLLYTSGTTGKPKGAELTHFQLFMNCTLGRDLIQGCSTDVAIGVLPLFHVFGLSSVLNVAVRSASSVVLLPRFDPDAVTEAIRVHGATVFAGVPTMYNAMLGAEESGGFATLRVAVSGGAPLPHETLRAFEERFDGVTILEGYGLSESASTVTFNVSAERRKPGSAGLPIWGVEVRILDGSGSAAPQGSDHSGEIVVRGHNVMKGYYANPDATAAAIQDGWFHTGDIGYLDEDGYLFVVDRLKDVILRGGYNVYPRELEEVLYEHPDIREAAVVGRPDPVLGEEVVAVVSLVPGARATNTDLVEYCRKTMARYKYPRVVQILDELPKGPTGKILKRELRNG